MIVYLLTNNVNGKRYVGQTIHTLEERLRGHAWPSTARHTKMPIARAIQKYGIQNFRAEILQECSSQDELDQSELRYALSLKTFVPNGYNLKAGQGRGSVSQVTKDRIGAAHRGKIVSDETRRKLSESHMGHRHSATTIAKMSAYWKGRRASDLAYQRSIEHNVKTYVLRSPDGIVTTIINMKAFCEQAGYSKSKMCELVRGKRDQYRQWTRVA